MKPRRPELTRRRAWVWCSCGADAVLMAVATASAQGAPHISPVTDAMLAAPAADDWLSWRRTTNSWGYSPLKQIDPRNVRRLALVWARGVDPGRQEGTPLVHDGVLFMPEPNHGVTAYDAGTGDLLWRYRREVPADINASVSLPDTNRNIAIFANLIIAATADGFLVALDSASGQLVWQTMVNDYHTAGASPTSGPIIAGGRVISSRSCEPRGGPAACVITAHDALTGRELWRTRTIAKEGGPEGNSWGEIPDAERRHVGAWMPASYDPALDLIYIGTSVTSPAAKFLLAGNDREYLYHNSTLALDPATGRIVWHYQHIVDHWDMDHPFERMLVDTVVAPLAVDVPWINPRIRPGEVRQVVTGIPGKTGIVYTLDRRTGEFLWARPTVEQNMVSTIDGASGRVTVNPAVQFHAMGDERRICPSRDGGKNWPAGAYSPLTNWIYEPVQNACARMTVTIAKPTLTSRYGHRYVNEFADGKHDLGAIYAVSAVTGKTEWRHEQRAAMLSLVATGGGLVFGGDAAGRFKAFDQKSGKQLWEVNLGSPVTGYPISFAVGGRQYLAVSTGLFAELASLTPELHAGADNMLYIFALPDKRRRT